MSATAVLDAAGLVLASFIFPFQIRQSCAAGLIFQEKNLSIPTADGFSITTTLKFSALKSAPIMTALFGTRTEADAAHMAQDLCSARLFRSGRGCSKAKKPGTTAQKTVLELMSGVFGQKKRLRSRKNFMMKTSLFIGIR